MRRVLLVVAYAVYLCVTAYLVWSRHSTTASAAVVDVTAALNRLGIPVTTDLVEFGLNVALFVPMSLLGAFVFRWYRVSDWVLVGFVGSFVVELVQLFLLPARDASSRDIVANTLGALIGAVLAWTAVAVLERRPRVSLRPVEGAAPAGSVRPLDGAP
jgi:VanZ family protein